LHLDYGNLPDPGPDAGIPVQTVTPGILLPGGSLACDPTTNDPCVQTGIQAMAILKQDCSNCHGEQAGVASGNPQWNFVLNINEMETSTIDTAINPSTGQPWRFLIAGDPDNSRIYVRVASNLMPPADQNGEAPKPRPSLSDVSVLRHWISSCLGGAANGPSTGTGGLDAADGAQNETNGSTGGAAAPDASASGGRGAGGSGGGRGGVDGGQRDSGPPEANTAQPYGTAIWRPTASMSAAGPTQPLSALDGAIATRWTTGQAQRGNEWFFVDLGAVVPISRVVLDDTMHPGDFPVAYTLQVSTNDRAYSVVAMGAGSTVTDISFAQIMARFVWIRQTGMTPAPSGNWWSIDELRIYP